MVLFLLFQLKEERKIQDTGRSRKRKKWEEMAGSAAEKNTGVRRRCKEIQVETGGKDGVKGETETETDVDFSYPFLSCTMPTKLSMLPTFVIQA